MQDETFKIVVKMKRRPDGGLRVWSDDVPGLVLSHRDPNKVLADIQPALEMILSETMGCTVKAERLVRIPARALASNPRPAPVRKPSRLSGIVGAFRSKLEFSATPCPA